MPRFGVSPRVEEAPETFTMLPGVSSEEEAAEKLPCANSRIRNLVGVAVGFAEFPA